MQDQSSFDQGEQEPDVDLLIDKATIGQDLPVVDGFVLIVGGSVATGQEVNEAPDAADNDEIARIVLQFATSSSS